DERILDLRVLDERLLDIRVLDLGVVDDVQLDVQLEYGGGGRRVGVGLAARLPLFARARPPNAARALPLGAPLYIALLLGAAGAVAAPVLLRLSPDRQELGTFAVLAAGAAVGSFFLASTERNHGFNTALLFIAAAVFLLPPEFVALMGLAQFWPELVRRRYPWYSAVFNLANYTLNGLAAWFVFRLLVPAGSEFRGVTSAL